MSDQIDHDEVFEALVEFQDGVLQSKVAVKIDAIKNLTKFLSTRDISGNQLRFLSKLILASQYCYRENNSRREIEAFLKFLVDKFFDVKFPNIFTKAIYDYANDKRKGSLVRRSLVKSTYILLKWTLIVGHNSRILPLHFSDVLNILIKEIQHNRELWKTINKLKSFFNNLSKEFKILFFSSITNEASDLIISSVLIKSLAETGKLRSFLSHEDLPSSEEIIELFLKKYLMVRVRQPPWNLEKVTLFLMPSLITEGDFKKFLLPAFQKAMLRTPETAVEVIGFSLENMKNINLEPYALDIAKLISPSLHSTSEICRKDAVFASKASVKNRSDDAVNIIIDWYFQVYNGSEGKLTVANHKLTILEAITQMGIVAKNDSEKQKSALLVFEKCVKIMEMEVNEGILNGCIEALQAWTYALGDNCPLSFVNYIKKAWKSLKPSVKIHISDLLATVFIEKRISHITPVLDIINKEYKSNYTNVPNLGESICLLLILLRCKGISKESFDFALSTLPGVLKLVNEKFTSNSSESILAKFIHLVKVAIVIDYKIIQSSLYSYALTIFHKNEKVRAMARDVFKSKKIKDAQTLILDTVKAANDIPVPANENKVPMAIKEFVLDVAKILSEKQDSVVENIALKLVDIIHVYENSSFWIFSLHCMKINPEKFVKKYWESNFEKYINNYDNSELSKKIVQSLFKLNEDKVTEIITNKFKTCMNDPEIKKITRDDYFIFCTSEGQLYNTSVLECSDEKGNLKRESKAYSYKEQLEEIKLRKELEEKRKREGKFQLSAKQKQAQQAQLEKESQIRKHVLKLYESIVNTIGLIQSTIVDNENIWYLKDIMASIISSMESPLVAPLTVDLFLQLGNQIFYFDRATGETIAHVTLAAIKPQCDLPQSSNASLISTFNKLLIKLKEYARNCERFTSINFTYIFPLLLHVVHNCSKYESLILNVLKIINASLRKKSMELQHSTKLIPRNEVCELLYFVMGTHSGTVQQTAASTLFELARTGNNANANQALASSEELNFHLNALMSHLSVARDSSLRSLKLCSKAFKPLEGGQIFDDLKINIFREKFETDTQIAALSDDLWSHLELETSLDLLEKLINLLCHSCENVRVSGAKALGNLLNSYPDCTEKTIEKLVVLYNENLSYTPSKVDTFGRVIEEGMDKWEGRTGVGLAIIEIAPIMPPNSGKFLMEWLLRDSLADRNREVQSIMLEGAVEIVKCLGKVNLDDFIKQIGVILENAENSRKYDNVRQACVVLMGSLARHLDSTDERVKSIFYTLLDTLSTPSEKVQESVANCLPALVPSVSKDANEILNKLIEKLKVVETYGERRGAAYGIAGMIKGLGILSLKEYDIMNILAIGMQDKKNFKHREGTLMSLELLYAFMGRLFEPYIVHVLPYLLQCLGDSNQFVRETSENTANSVMGNLSSHGVKLVLPSLLDGLNEDHWRSKSGSVDLLGKMAYCAPKQLSGCLPMIVPRLIEVLGDSHVKVQESGAKALRLIGSVIKNPEIQSVVPILLEALQDPGKKTTACLQVLLRTEFIHFVDPPSLALIMPVVERAFQDRSTENRKMASQVIGNMYSLTDHTDLSPYLEKVMPGLKTSLLDPVPEVRTVAAKALGAMAIGMGEKCYEELLPWLTKTLVSESSSVDRSGSAQGLAEVIGALGEEKLHRFMPEIIKKSEADDVPPHTRDGYMMMFIYMPSVFEDAFVIYIGQIIKPILKALADENEFVRETALRAGQRIVTGYADSAITLLLPELERGIFDDNWRIRFASIQLLGDLLYKISGVSGKMSTETANEDDNFGTEHNQQVIINSLGIKRRNRVLAGLYMGRSDVALLVRQASLHVWKVIVANTPKTLREILPTLFSLLLGCLASKSQDKRQVAARTLGDLVRKLGEKILPEIIPILEKGLESPKDEERQGVCIGLSEIMASTSRDMILAFVDNLVPTLRKALCDPSPLVRQAAGQTFGSLHASVGSRALDEILPYMMKKMHDPDEGEYALDGLSQLLTVKSKAVMPYLVPQLTTQPVNIKALAILASVAGDSLSRHLNKIIPALISVLCTENVTEQDKDYCDQVILSVVDEFGVRHIIEEFLGLMSKDNTEKLNIKIAGVQLLYTFCARTKVCLTDFIPQLLRGFILLLVHPEEAIQKIASDALAAIVKNMTVEEQENYVSEVRQSLSFAKSDIKGKHDLIPGLCLPKGVAPLLPVFRMALLNGSAQLKEEAAEGMQELIGLSSPEAIKPSVIHITGPLIRILGDRYGCNVRVAVIETIRVLLSKVGPFLRSFLPQLQTTLLKATTDSNRPVRLKAAHALADLIPVHNKPELLFQELLSLIKQSEDLSVKETLIYTLRCITVSGGSRMNETQRNTSIHFLTTILASSDEALKTVSAGCFGAMFKYMPQGELDTQMAFLLLDDSEFIKQGKSSSLCLALRHIPAVYNEKKTDKINNYILSLLASDNLTLVLNGIRCCGYILMYTTLEDLIPPKILITPFAKAVNKNCNDTKTFLGSVCEFVARKVYPKILPHDLLKYLLPALVNGTKEKNSIVKASCESALVNILHLRQNENTLKECLSILELGAQESLQDVINKVLRKSSKQQIGKEPEIDDTILTN